jgi:hypothetical protein
VVRRRYRLAAALVAPLALGVACGGSERAKDDDDPGVGGATAGSARGGTSGGTVTGGAGTSSGGSGAGGDSGGKSGGASGAAAGEGGVGEPTGGSAGSGGSGGTGGGAGSGDSGGLSGSAGVSGSAGSGIGVGEEHRGGFCAERWCWSTHLPQGNAIRELFSSEAIGVWASTDGSSLLRWNGAGWERVALPGRGYPKVWGSSPDDIFVGIGQDFWHLRGDSAERRTLEGTDYSITAISGTGPEDVWVAADGAFLFDGTGFARVLGVPVVGALVDLLVVGPNRVWLVGPTSGHGVGYWNGTDYSIIAPGVTNPLLFVDGEIWYGTGTAIMHGNEVDGFAEVPATTGGRRLFGTASDDIYDIEDGVIWHFDGDEWTDLTMGTGTDGSAQADGTSYQRGEAFTGGRWGRLFRVDDGVIEPTTQSIPELLRQDITRVWSDGSRVYAVGPALLELDASGESDVWEALPGPSADFYPQAIWGSAPDDIWLVGSGERIYHFDGSDVVEIPNDSPAGTIFSDIHGSGPDDIWAVGTNGKAKHYDGMAWVTVTTASVSDIDDVWVAPDGNAWAVGENGIVMRYTPGSGWDDELDVTVSTVQWKAVAGTSSSDVWIAGYHNQMAHFDGTEWSFDEGSGYPSGHVNKLWALASDDIWGVADFGAIIHYDGVSWRLLESRTAPSFTGLWIGADGEGWVVGEYGAILHRLAD